jgi:hypothetical protein
MRAEVGPRVRRHGPEIEQETKMTRTMRMTALATGSVVAQRPTVQAFPSAPTAAFGCRSSAPTATGR